MCACILKLNGYSSCAPQKHKPMENENSKSIGQKLCEELGAPLSGLERKLAYIFFFSDSAVLWKECLFRAFQEARRQGWRAGM